MTEHPDRSKSTTEPPRIVTFGETMLRLSSPRGERLETTETIDLSIGGAESNVALAAQRLGLDATWCSKLPDSPLGRRVCNPLQAQNVSVEIEWDSTRRQGTYFIEQGGSPRGTNVIYDRENAAVTSLTPDELPMERIRDASAVFTTGITPALSETLRETTRSVFEAAREAGTRTVFDVNYRSKLWSKAEATETIDALLSVVDVLVVAKRDAEAILGQTGSSGTIATTLREEYAPSLVVVTDGERGAVAGHRDGVTERSAIDAETCDPIGSGDAFVGGFLAWYLRDAPIGDALSAGAAAASLKRTLDGDLAIIDRDEVRQAMRGGADGIDR
ncbi:bifunctional 2-dehydro-3-deoxygluconokinase/2-dehydro-3-deoxygalactonokinase [Halorhabdus amylolytica]|uniref:bifunctional 2-dehydro-3-deoxygluconokinase/2-dehydro-3- deoxygalactonokinase n=1 Tax=Halorhabdus amylolytica TaxID=2559573 RepID=UPI0010AAC29A|nr:bifunctional 2-dehydro-3-deoxygluconokinase/2-dehydro-3-deoxygalactonokinase [Halorhabdus amylolytica]